MYYDVRERRLGEILFSNNKRFLARVNSDFIAIKTASHTRVVCDSLTHEDILKYYLLKCLDT